MPEITVLHIAVLAGAVVVGIVTGWIVRGHRTAGEKAAINAGWQEQIEAQRSEHERLLDQNRSLMEQNSQYQASNKDAKMRASELSGALKEAFERRDELQRQIKEIRSNLERSISERDQLQSKVRQSDGTADVLRQRDEQIARLQKDLENWRERLPPLIERYKLRNEEAERLEQELAAARDRVAALESMVSSDETHVEPVDREALGDQLDASNEPLGDDGSGDFRRVDEADDDEASIYADGDQELVAAEALIDDDVEVDTEEADDIDAEYGTPANEDDDSGGDDGDDESADDDEFDTRTEADGEHGDATNDDSADDSDHDAWADDDDDFDAADPGADDPGTDYGAGRLQRDNLKLIKGVGPAIEKTLNEMGIFRFNQIAEMSEYDIDRVAHRLKGFRSRIYREDWIGQARELQLHKASG